MNHRERNPARYARLNVPFDTEDEANEALNAFLAAVQEAREVHGIADVHVIARITVVVPSAEGAEPSPEPASEPSEARVALLQLGDERNAEPMTAYAYGFEVGQTTKRAAAYLAAGKKAGSQ